MTTTAQRLAQADALLFNTRAMVNMLRHTITEEGFVVRGFTEEAAKGAAAAAGTAADMLSDLLDDAEQQDEVDAHRLSMMPELSVIMDNSGDVWQMRGGLWCSHETKPMTSARVIKYAPITILHRGEA